MSSSTSSPARHLVSEGRRPAAALLWDLTLHSFIRQCILIVYCVPGTVLAGAARMNFLNEEQSAKACPDLMELTFSLLISASHSKTEL